MREVVRGMDKCSKQSYVLCDEILRLITMNDRRSLSTSIYLRGLAFLGVLGARISRSPRWLMYEGLCQAIPRACGAEEVT